MTLAHQDIFESIKADGLTAGVTAGREGEKTDNRLNQVIFSSCVIRIWSFHLNSSIEEVSGFSPQAAFTVQVVHLMK